MQRQSSMSNKMKKLAAIGLLSMTVGCAASGPAFVPVDAIPAEKALVYVYRPNSFIGAAVSYTVHAGDTPIVKLKRGGYFPYLATPGETEFWAKTEARTSLTKLLEAGETYYLESGLGVGFAVGRPRLNFVDERKGRAEVAKCKLLDAP